MQMWLLNKQGQGTKSYRSDRFTASLINLSLNLIIKSVILLNVNYLRILQFAFLAQVFDEKTRIFMKAFYNARVLL